MNKALTDIRQIKPKRNLKAFDALVLGAMRIKFTAKKLAYLPWEKLKSRDEAMLYTSKALYLAGELEKLRNYHEKCGLLQIEDLIGDM